MPKQSAGLLLYRKRASKIEVFLVHPGGPFFAKKDHGAWSLPKGEFADEEEPLAAAQREFSEETGSVLSGPFRALGSIKQAGGKTVFAWAVEGDLDATKIVSNTFRLEWPPRSEKFLDFPEVDRAAWFSLEEAKIKLNAKQIAFLIRLEAEDS